MSHPFILGLPGFSFLIWDLGMNHFVMFSPALLAKLTTNYYIPIALFI